MTTAQYFPEKDIWTVKNQEFERIQMAISFGNPQRSHQKHHAVAVAGRRIDNVILLLEGFFGYLDELGTEVVNLKDRYKIKRCLVPTDQPELVRELRQIEGLTHYDKQKDRTTNRVTYKTPASTWPYFTGRECLCVLVPVLPNLEADFMASVQLFESRVGRGEILLPKDWKGLNRLLSRPLRETIDNSILRASVYVCLSLTKRNSPTGEKTNPGNSRYGNLPRR